MKLSLWSLLTLGLCASTATAFASSEARSPADFDIEEPIPGSYLVELESDETPDHFFEDLTAAGINFERSLTLNWKVFNGVSFKLTDTANNDKISISRIARQLKVKNTWPVRSISLPEPIGRTVGSGRNSPSSRVKALKSSNSTGYTPHVMTGIDKLHAAGYTGKGKRIAVIDTGVDYTHPSLGGCFGKGCKVSYGWDLVGDDFHPAADPIPDDDPYEDMNFHGTHVSGIVAALKDDLGFIGAAPDAELGVYKIVGRNNSHTREDIVIEAMCRAFEDGSDVITMSWGWRNNWAQHPLGIVASRIVEQGVPFTVSAGNEGESGLWLVGSPATGKGVTAVGAAATRDVPYLLLEGSWTLDGGEPQSFGWGQGKPAIASNTTLPLWALDDWELGTRACDLPEDLPDLSGKFILVQFWQGDVDECNQGLQVANLAARGAEYIIFYTPYDVVIGDWPVTELGLLGLIKVPPSQAKPWIEALAEGANITVTVPQPNLTETYVKIAENTRNPGAVTYFSSWGPTWELDMKPQVIAPGQDIFSTYPLALGGYATMSGTSMATPLVAGLYALLMEARETTDPEELLTILMSQAEPATFYDYEKDEWSDFLAPVAQQGAGFVQGWKSAQVTNTLSTGSLAFNDTDNFVNVHTFTVFNDGDEDVTYSLSHLEAPAVLSFNEDTLWAQTHPLSLVEETATVKFSSSKVTVAAGESANITITPSLPTKLDADLLPVYGGYIQLEGSNNESFVVPYLGVAANMRDTKILELGDGKRTYMYAQGALEDAVEANTTFQIEKRESITDIPQNGDPTVQISNRMGTRLLRADVVALDTTNVTTTQFFNYDVVGSLKNFPMEWKGATYGYNMGSFFLYFSERQSFWGVLSDGMAVPEGHYQIVVSALKIFGDLDKKEDWEFVELVPFKLQYT